MRELKFEVFDKKEKHVLEVLEIDFLNEMFVISDYGAIDEFECHSQSFDNVELMQYTGLKDKNNNEIYEGYIIDYEVSRTEHTNCVVKWVDKYSCFIALDNLGVEYFIQEIDKRRMKVIGNIYENPELFK